MNQILVILLFTLAKFGLYNSTKKNLIIGAIKSYEWKAIKPFFVSLYYSNFRETDCVIFALDISKKTLDKLQSIGVIVQNFPDKYRYMKINNVRYKLYEEFLRDKLDKYNMVLHADIRDIFFQKDIFQLYENKGKFIGLGLESGTISEQRNANWMKNQYGEKIFEELKNEKIICSGTIFGTAAEFYLLVKNIWEQILLKSPYDINIHDQTATNYLIYHKKMFNDCLIFLDNYNGSIMTVGIDKNKNFSFDLDNNLLNFNSTNKPAVIHQYDRIPKMVEIVNKKFGNQFEDNLNLTSRATIKKTKVDELLNKLSFDPKQFQIIFVLINFSLILILILKISIKNYYLYKKN